MPDIATAAPIAASAVPPSPGIPGEGRRATIDRLPLHETFDPEAGSAHIPPTVRKLRLFVLGSLLLLFFIVVPVLTGMGIVKDHNLNRLGRYLCFAIVALGIDLIWGYTGLLSLGQAFFFCLGAYAISMHLALPQGGGDVRPEYNNIPQFMFFNNVHSLDQAPFWIPFSSGVFALGAAILLPALLASVFGFFIFRSRVRGVYFSIITQAVAWGAWLVVSRNEMLLGGTNGLTNFYKPLNQDQRWIIGLYLGTLTTLALTYLLCRHITASRLGRILVAIRDRESRLYFTGYRPYRFKVFAFATAAVLAAIGGILYVPQTGIITPARMKVEESVMMVIWVALGGRGRLWGAVFGTLLVNFSYSALTSDMPAAWPFIQGAMFLAVVLLFPQGFVGMWDDVERQVASRASILRIVLSAAPFLAVSLFILTEALGLVPSIASRDIAKVQLRYWLLLVIFIATLGSRLLRPAATGATVSAVHPLQPVATGGTHP